VGFLSAPGPLEIMVILAIALVVLGPSRLPDAARSVGKGMREFRESLSGFGGDDDEDEQTFEDPYDSGLLDDEPLAEEDEGAEDPARRDPPPERDS
jgi:sec-independent protein translocase protein TatA